FINSLWIAFFFFFLTFLSQSSSSQRKIKQKNGACSELRRRLKTIQIPRQIRTQALHQRSPPRVLHGLIGSRRRRSFIGAQRRRREKSQHSVDCRSPAFSPARPPSIFPCPEKTNSGDGAAVAGAPPFSLARRRPSSGEVFVLCPDGVRRNAAEKETSQNRRLSAEEGDDGASLSSPNSAATSSFRMEFGIGGFGFPSSNKRDLEEGERANASEDDENGSGRKKLRLSKDQSAFLEESFKEHNTLNPKQKLALAKQLNLRPRQVEVWFQNRRARTKLKQTEVDCEYLKRCCETLTEENRRLQKELQELRALKTSQPFYMQLPATTLTMCPSCERVATTTSAAAATAAAAAATSTTTNSSSTTLSLGKVGSSSSNGKVCPFPSVQLQMSQSSSQPSS
ncbi:Homeobox-leucine zipper protein HAT14, partial [Linum perenne]